MSSHEPPAAPRPATTTTADQATIGKSLVIKGEVTGSESLYIDGRVEGSINLSGNRVTVGRNGVVAANINAREIVVLGKVRGNLTASDRVDIRSDGSLTGDVVAARIAIEDGAYEVEKASRSFMNTYIFPNGCLPSMKVIARGVERRTDMTIAHIEDISSHYVRTLRHWRSNFERNVDRLVALGYDERFRRIWMLYLAYCEAGFAERRIRDLQILITKPRRLAGVISQARSGRALSGAAAG